MWAIFKKELKSYFLSPIGYVVIGIFLAVFSIFFYGTIISSGTVDLGILYYNVSFYGLVIIAPILTMRMFAEERKNGTEQLLLTSPVSMTKVVLGKFMAAMAVMIITLLASFIYYFIVEYFGEPNLPLVLVNILGFILLGGAAISIGMFASSITENQIIAGIITIAFLLMSIFIGELDNELANIVIFNFYLDFPSGVISFKEVVGLISFTGMFTAFTTIVMQRRKLVK